MSKSVRRTILIIGYILSAAWAFSQPDGAVITSIEIENFKYTASLDLTSDLNLEYEAYVLDNPPRIILDPIGTALTDIKTGDLKFKEGLVEGIDMVKGTQEDGDKRYYPLDFISVKLAAPSSFHMKKDNNTVILDIGGEGAALEKEIDAAIAEKKRERLLDKTRDEKIKKVALEMEARLRDELLKNRMAREHDRELLQAEVEQMKREDIAKIREGLEKAKSRIKEKLKGELADELFMPKSFLKESGGDLKEADVMLESEADILEKLKAHEEEAGYVDFQESMEIALANYGPAKVQKEEINLALMKVKEAWRALYPQANFEFTQRTGNVEGTEAKFTERAYSLNLEQPLFYSGRLVDTLKKSEVNADVARMKYEKTKNELYYKVSEAYYNLVTSFGNIGLQKDLLDASKRYLKMAEARYKAGLSTQNELMNVRSKSNQIYYQLVTAEKDLALAKLKFNQALGLHEDEPVGMTEWKLPFADIDVDLDEMTELALKSNPDIRVNELLVEFNEYEERVARKKDAWKVDLTGAIGASGSGFETEPLGLSPDLNFGIKFTKGWGGSTMSYTSGHEELSPKTGQRDRTESNTQTARITLLNDLKTQYEKKEASIARDKALNDLKDAKANLIREAREAYFNYQEAVIQVRNALEKAKYRMEALKFAQSELELNQGEISQVLEARINLTDEQHQYLEALSNYHISLAKLNKVVGIRNYFNLEEASDGSVQD